MFSAYWRSLCFATEREGRVICAIVYVISVIMWCFKTIMALTLLSLATARPTQAPTMGEFLRPYLSSSYYDGFNREDLLNFILKNVNQLLQNSPTKSGVRTSEKYQPLENPMEFSTAGPYEGGDENSEKYQPPENATVFSTAAPYKEGDENSEKYQRPLENATEFSTAAPYEGDDELSEKYQGTLIDTNEETYSTVTLNED